MQLEISVFSALDLRYSPLHTLLTHTVLPFVFAAQSASWVQSVTVAGAESEKNSSVTLFFAVAD